MRSILLPNLVPIVSLFAGERIGNLVVVQKSEKTKKAVLSQLVLSVPFVYNTPPAHGARIVDTVLNDNELRAEWLDNVKTMSSRIIKMREALFESLTKLQTPGTWKHIIEQKGMFSYTGLSPAEVKHMIEVHHVYLRSTGRINIGELNGLNVEYVAKAIHETVSWKLCN